MTNDLYDSNLLQGIIFVKGDPAGRGRYCIPVYYSPLKGIFDSAKKSGEVFGYPIVDSIWYNEPLGWEEITKIGDKITTRYTELSIMNVREKLIKSVSPQ